VSEGGRLRWRRRRAHRGRFAPISVVSFRQPTSPVCARCSSKVLISGRPGLHDTSLWTHPVWEVTRVGWPSSCGSSDWSQPPSGADEQRSCLYVADPRDAHTAAPTVPAASRGRTEKAGLPLKPRRQDSVPRNHVAPEPRIPMIATPDNFISARRSACESAIKWTVSHALGSPGSLTKWLNPNRPIPRRASTRTV
jgi:hypothetical protein